jgi:hypothetical protein
MFYDGTEGEYPAGFANGYVDVPLSLYATTQSNYFDNEKQHYKYVDGEVTHWVFARVYAITSLSANNGGEMMYEYDRRLLANRIVGLNKRVFAHHEELDAYVDLSDNRAFFHSMQLGSVVTQQPNMLEKMLDTYGLTDDQLLLLAQPSLKKSTLDAVSDVNFSYL